MRKQAQAPRMITGVEAQMEALGEKVGDASVLETTEAVDLGIAFTPVIISPCRTDVFEPEHVPELANVTKLSDKEYIVYLRNETIIIEAEALQIMRARYLLWKGHFYKMLEEGTIHHPMTRNVVLGRFFPGGTVLLNLLKRG